MTGNDSTRIREPKRVFIVDDHAILREGLIALINAESDLKICGESSNAPDAMHGLETAQADVIIVDISLLTSSGIDLIQDIKPVYPELPILVLSAHDEVRYAERCIKAGAMGYVMKSATRGSIVAALRRIMNGEIYVSSEMIPNLMAKYLKRTHSAAILPQEVLTDREIDVFDLIGRGFTVLDISRHLCLSDRTVRIHQEHIRTKLNLPNAVRLHQAASHWVQSEGAI